MEATEIALTEVLLQADPQDGNDLLEAVVRLPIVPRKGDSIEVWNSEGGFRNPNGMSGESIYLDVEHVSLCAYAPERICVSVRMEGYDLEELRQAMEAANRGEQP